MTILKSLAGIRRSKTSNNDSSRALGLLNDTELAQSQQDLWLQKSPGMKVSAEPDPGVAQWAGHYIMLLIVHQSTAGEISPSISLGRKTAFSNT